MISFIIKKFRENVWNPFPLSLIVASSAIILSISANIDDEFHVPLTIHHKMTIQQGFTSTVFATHQESFKLHYVVNRYGKGDNFILTCPPSESKRKKSHDKQMPARTNPTCRIATP
eukprot:GDKH01000253.1.p1 GENE.GDKH01000253.1~~GDKH01000253.1.p1  ORF type:complete len:116 (-),score=3.85 GDKH01000253.1:475-822(-)